MRVTEVKNFLSERGLADSYMEFATSSATVDLAAAAVGCEPGRIAKTLCFKTRGGPIVVVAMGTSRVDNKKFKEHFGEKACFPKPEEVAELTGHPVGGVCPFALMPGVKIYLDQALKKFDPIYPAAGAANNAVRISLSDLELFTGGKWIDVCRE